MKKEEMVYPKIKQLAYTDILISADYTGKDSGIVGADGKSATRMMKQVQTVLAVGPHSQRSADRHGFSQGDKVILDVDKLIGKRQNGESAARMITIPYNNKTGQILIEVKKDDIKEADVSYAVMIDPRSVLMILE